MQWTLVSKLICLSIASHRISLWGLRIALTCTIIIIYGGPFFTDTTYSINACTFVCTLVATEMAIDSETLKCELSK